jgi:hypothetical protein
MEVGEIVENLIDVRKKIKIFYMKNVKKKENLFCNNFFYLNSNKK